jgi:hypothetical protein
MYYIILVAATVAMHYSSILDFATWLSPGQQYSSTFIYFSCAVADTAELVQILTPEQVQQYKY